MNINEYINSGILELYVYGALSEDESAEVSRNVQEYPEIKREVEEIEKSLQNLSEAVAPGNPQFLIQSIKAKIAARNSHFIGERKSRNWASYIGWAASILFLLGLFLMFNRNQELKDSLQALQAEKALIESQIAEARDDAAKAEQLLDILRDRNILEVPLPGQAVAPEAYATAYWDKNDNVTYIDARDLPEPPRGMVYQVWSLKMDPLTPSSLGLLSEYETDDNKIFKLENTNVSEGFGITLEPAGGSETPTLERLYALGTVSSS